MITVISLALAMASAVDPADTVIDDLSALQSMQDYFEERVVGNRHLDGTPGHIDVVIQPGFVQSAFRLSIEPEVKGDSTCNTVTVLDMKEPAWAAAHRLFEAGLRDAPAAWERVVRTEFTVDSCTCGNLDAAVVEFQDAFDAAKDAFRLSRVDEYTGVITLHPRLIEIRGTNANSETLAFFAKNKGPGTIMQRAEQITQIAAGCAKSPVRHLDDI
jgi:hypothetical protein